MQHTRVTIVSIFTFIGVLVALSSSVIRAGEEGAEAKKLAEAVKKDLQDFNDYRPLTDFHRNRLVSQKAWERFEEESKERRDDWKKAAEAGIPEGQVLLGIHYLRNIRSAENVAEIAETMLELFRKAAEQGNADGQYWYAWVAHIDGADRRQRTEWLRKAAEQGHVRAQYELALAIQFAPSYTTDADHRERLDESARWHLKAAEQGHPESQWITGLNYRGRGGNFPYDREKSAKWFRKSAEQGVPGAMTRLALCYLNGDGIPQDVEKAVKWFRKAAEQGDSWAMHYLGECYLKGHGVTQDAEKAVEWFRKSAAQTHPYPAAWYKLGWCYATGTGVSQDKEEAMRWLREAEERFPFLRKYSNETVALLKKLEAGVEINGKDSEPTSGFWHWLFGGRQGTTR